MLFKYMFKFEVFSLHTRDNFSTLKYLVAGFLNSLLTGLYCMKNKDLALFSLSLICGVYKASSDKPDVVCKQTPPASTARESLEYSTWEQLLLYQSDTVIYEVSNPLAFEEFRPSHLSFVFISVVLVTHCPHKPWNGSVDLWQMNGGGSSPPPPPFEEGNKLWMRNQERMGKWVTVLCHCGVHSIIPPGPEPCLQFKGERKLSFTDWVSVLTVSEWKCCNMPLFA